MNKDGRKWKSCQYNQPVGNFPRFSNIIVGRKDSWLKFLPNPDNRFFWTKKILLRPVYGDDTKTFFVAFQDKNGKSKYYSELRTVEQGPFYMRLGPENGQFFLISQSSVKLAIEVVYHRLRRKKYDLY